MMTASDIQPYLTFRLADQRYALPIMAVIEVAPMVATSTLPDAPHGVLGVVNRQSEPMLLLDLRLIFGLNAEPVTVSTLFIVVKHDAQWLGLVVDEIFQVEYIDTRTAKSTNAGQHIKQIVSHEKALYQVIDLSALVTNYLGQIEH